MKNSIQNPIHFLILIFLIFLTSGFKPSPTLAKIETSNLSEHHILVGEHLKLKSHREILVESQNIFKVTDLGEQVQVTGLKIGTALLRLGKWTHKVHVLSWKQEETKNLLDNVVKKTLGLKVLIQDSNVVLSGQLFRCEDWVRIATECQKINCRYQAHFQVNESIWNQCQNRLQAELRQRGLPQVKLNHHRKIESRLSDAQIQTPGLSEFLDSFGVLTTVDKNMVELAPMVKVEVWIVEVRKDFTEKTGITWPQGFEFQAVPKLNSDQQLNALLSALENEGTGQILARPNLLCRSGKSAEFLAGGEFPIKILNYKMHDVVWKRYGIHLKVSPKADTSGSLSLELSTEVSSIDPSRTVDGIPGILSNRIHSFIDLAESKTIALSGLIKQEQSQAAQGIWGLRNIPLIGSLFESKDFRENRSELVVILRPQVIKEIENETL